MTTTMSMTERHKRVEELVMQDPRVLACARTFGDAQADISRWHVTNKTALRATMGQLDELNELIAFSEFCLEDLKCAKRKAYKQVNTRYPRIWDTTCADPFDADTQDDEAKAGAETEEMSTIHPDGDGTPCTCAMCQAEDGELAEKEEMITISKAEAADELVNVYGGHIDKWLEALRERTHAQTVADDDAEAAETDGTEDGYCGVNVPLRAVEAINSLDDAGLCVAVDLIYAMLADITDLFRLDPRRLDGYRTQLTKTVFRRSGHESTSPCQGQRPAHPEGA